MSKIFSLDSSVIAKLIIFFDFISVNVKFILTKNGH